MASHQEALSSYPSFSNPTRRTWMYDIFLSFRGEDSRRGFTSHLYHALSRSGFRVFRDDEEIRRGDSITQDLLQAIEESQFAVVILSENYASSSWCLDELHHILASRKDTGQQVFPIFYYASPSDVRNQRGPFGQAFTKPEKKFLKDQLAKLEKKPQKDRSKVKKWRDSLRDVADLSGLHSVQYRELSKRHGLLRLQNKLLSHLKAKNFQFEDTHQGKNILGYFFCNRKVMLILDDVNHISQLENLAGSRGRFGGGSRIIITTKDADIPRSHQVGEMHEVKPMNKDKSLQPFCEKAF